MWWLPEDESEVVRLHTQEETYMFRILMDTIKLPFKMIIPVNSPTNLVGRRMAVPVSPALKTFPPVHL